MLGQRKPGPGGSFPLSASSVHVWRFFGVVVT